MRAFRSCTWLLSSCLAVFLLLGASSGVAAQETGTIRGTVRNTEGQPLQGVQVYLEGTTVGSVTNADGRYTITRVPLGTHTVVAEFLGFGTARQTNVTVTAAEAGVVNFELRQQALALSELVVTGVTEATSRARLPFTVASVNRENMPVAPKSAVEAIQGKVAGATIVQSTQPGEAAAILLRSPTSINRENTPLIVVDGAILTQSSVDISTLDIESIEVVKGAAAASLYGSRAAAGVVQIRTARGSGIPENRTRFTIRSEFGANDVPHPIKWARHHPFRQNANGDFLERCPLVSGRPTCPGTGDSVRVVPTRQQADFKPIPFQDGTYPGAVYDHVNSLFDPGATITQHVSLGHNAGNTSWLATGSYHRTQGVVRELDGYGRADFRVNLDHRLANDLAFSASIFHMRSVQDDAAGGTFFDFVQIAPDVDLLQPDPDGTKYHFQPDDAGIRPNPLYRLVNETHEDKRQRTLGSLDLRYNPLAWLAFDVNGSYDRSDRDNVDYIPKGAKTANFPNGNPGSLVRFGGITSGINASAGVNVARDFGQLRTRTMVRGLLEREDLESVTAEGSSFSVGGLPDLDAATVSSVESLDQSIRSTGVFVNSELDWADKYIFSGLVRRDGSSLFGPELRWHTYYRVSGAYRMAAEPWWPIPQLNEFKLRYSRGTAGGRPNFADRFEVFSVQTGGGLELNVLGNPFLAPEKATEQEFGVDLVALGRYSLQLTYATQRTEDQLVQVPLPRIFGFGTKWENAGTIEGHTYEGTLEARLIDNQAMRWSVNVIADRSRNKITEYDRPCHTDDFGWRCAGETLGMMYGQKFLTSADELFGATARSRASEFQVNDDGILVWVGPNNTYRDGVSKNLWGTTTTIDGVSYTWGFPILLRDSLGAVTRVKIGDSNPNFNWGIANNLQWKGFNFYALVGGQVGGNIYNDTKQRMYQHQRHRDEDQDGKPEELKKPITYYTPGLYNAATNVSWFVEDARFTKLRELSVRYGLTASRLPALGRLGIDRAILSLIGRNLFIWTDYSGYDVEVQGADNAHTRVDSFNFPSYRTFTTSVEIIF
jgi:TonB-linked SusC/RagA family outer membrane protein